jgi:hypothetical protein
MLRTLRDKMQPSTSCFSLDLKPTSETDSTDASEANLKMVCVHRRMKSRRANSVEKRVNMTRRTEIMIFTHRDTFGIEVAQEFRVGILKYRQIARKIS